MGMLRFSVISFALTALGCGGGSSSVVPTGPSQSLPPASTVVPSREPMVPANAATITVGEVVKGQVTGEDPLCDPGGRHRCRYYRLVSPADGILEVTIKWSAQQVDPYPLDVDIINASVRIGLAPAIGPGPQRRTSVRIKAGDAYAIEVWSFLSPSEPFELSTALRQ